MNEIIPHSNRVKQKFKSMLHSIFGERQMHTSNIEIANIFLFCFA